MRIRTAVPGDTDGFLALAASVEQWFGPMVDDPGFREALDRNIGRGSAFVARDNDERLLGGILTGGRHPAYRVNWLVIDAAARRTGVGRALVTHLIGRCTRPGTVDVVSFDEGHPTGASQFYRRLGFVAGEPAPEGRRHFRLTLI